MNNGVMTSGLHENSIGGIFTVISDMTSAFGGSTLTKNFSDSSLTSYLMTEWNEFKKHRNTNESSNMNNK